MNSGVAQRRRWRFSPASSLIRRIVVINAVGLGLLVAGVLYLNQFRSGLIDLRAQALRTQGEIIAIAIAESAGGDASSLSLDPVRATLVLRRLAQPMAVRARIFDRSGRLTGDTREAVVSAAPIQARPLPAPGDLGRVGWLSMLETWYGNVVSLFRSEPPVFSETMIAGIAAEAEIYDALRGIPTTVVRLNSQDELIVSAALPIQHFKAVLGALVLSTEGGDIDAIVRAERIAILRVFLVAMAVSIALSVLLAGTIARPLRRLADAAMRSSASANRPVDPTRVSFPDLTSRADEIGHLSGALRDMTAALYTRIDGIERFAADVAHEIKNPLTSLRSAVETLRRAETADQVRRLLDVIQHDVRRLDRLVTDISNASRLDAEMVREAMEPVDLRALLNAVVEVAGGRDTAPGATARARLPPHKLMVRGLESRLGQVFRNLVENALSFSPPGGIVDIRVEEAAADAIRVSVEDQGPGVPDEQIEAIFNRFHTSRPEHEHFGDHSGLGLSISRQIVEAHGGRIWAENIRGAPDAPPSGARFVVELPR